jgi:SAM-dependent methyltransferase
MNNILENKICLACGSENLIPSLDLGSHPLANNLTTEPTTQETYPLAVNLCADCCHLQLTHTVDPAIIYSNYLYVAGTSKTLDQYSDWFAGYVAEIIDTKTFNILDIGCNDGTQLNHFKSRGFNTYGVDPAENIYPTSSKNHNVICNFFGPSIIEKIHHNFDAITAQNVFAHNPNPAEFLETCKKLMGNHTLLFIQTSQADMILNNEFDTIYHEHVNFFNINSMNKLVSRVGLELVDVVKTPIHGNSYIFVIGTKGKPYNIKNLISIESKLTDLQTYKNWEETVQKNMEELKLIIQKYINQGYKVVGYGAAAKGNTLLNYIQQPLDIIIDDSPLKQNRYAPGTNSPIKSIESLKEFSKQDKILFMPLAWNFFVEISQRIKTVRSEPQDLFLKYFPKVEIKNV